MLFLIVSRPAQVAGVWEAIGVTYGNIQFIQAIFKEIEQIPFAFEELDLGFADRGLQLQDEVNRAYLLIHVRRVIEAEAHVHCFFLRRTLRFYQISYDHSAGMQSTGNSCFKDVKKGDITPLCRSHHRQEAQP